MHPRTRVVLLGASNLTLAFPHVVAHVRSALRSPLDVFAAIGHGRSYGKTSRVLLRELPGITDCGLWAALDRSVGGDGALALLTDFGNDLVYGTDVGTIAQWIGSILERLASHRARCAIVRLPLQSLERLSPLRFRVARGILYPSHRVELAELRERAHALDERMLALARAHGAMLVEQRGEWYGFDPIHIRTGRRREAWDEILAPLVNGASGTSSRALERVERRALRRLRPEQRRWMGREQRRAQPAAELLDGTTISVY